MNLNNKTTTQVNLQSGVAAFLKTLNTPVGVCVSATGDQVLESADMVWVVQSVSGAVAEAVPFDGTSVLQCVDDFVPILGGSAKINENGLVDSSGSDCSLVCVTFPGGGIRLQQFISVVQVVSTSGGQIGPTFDGDNVFRGNNSFAKQVVGVPATSGNGFVTLSQASDQFVETTGNNTISGSTTFTGSQVPIIIKRRNNISPCYIEMKGVGGRDGYIGRPSSSSNNFSVTWEVADSDIDLISQRNISLSPKGAVTVNNKKILLLASPVDDTDAANKAYVDTIKTKIKEMVAASADYAAFKAAINTW